MLSPQKNNALSDELEALKNGQASGNDNVNALTNELTALKDLPNTPAEE